ncbi:hypothetical protein Mal4_30820 [Maioricimonas rarisocia]|uniref:Microcystinase C n=1 Tax=Maioricimonas rarisocia TaxID=2528026 RepID=A0A517Z8D2_9PLAN|nr:M81 family metallopeptidase [Maioricimonas rarisocia]QDU38752.1 hypothetical protein Mal4_30820 [Maioricimonas rarisocia]
MRIGILALLQETNTFIDQPTELEQFQENLFLRGEAIREQLATANHEIGGFFGGLAEGDCEIVPLFAARALPFGTVSHATCQTLFSEISRALDTAGPLDGVLLAPHGATVGRTTRDVDGHWLSMVRQHVGPDVPLISTADPHANLSPLMADSVDAIIAYRTNPHIDQRARGEEAARLMLRTLRKEVRPTMAAAFPPMLISIDRQCTTEEPCLALCNAVDEIRSRPGVLTASLYLGFPYSDVAEMGAAMTVVTDNDPQLARTLADELGQQMWAMRDELTARLVGVEEALDQAAGLEGPVLLLDMGDNVGGGSAADGTVLAEAIHRRQAGPAFVCLYDPEAVAQAAAAGPGAEVALAVGGKTDSLHGRPLEITATVKSLHDGRFEEPEARHGGMRHFDQGPTAVVTTAGGLTVMLTSRRMVPFSLHQLTDFGVDPAAFRLIVAKGVNAPIAAYAPVCPSLIRVNTPGVTTADLDQLTYHHRRQPMYPFEPATTWSPDTGSAGA